MELDVLLLHCLRHFVHLDHSNAAVHTARVRYSPITFRLAQEIERRVINGRTDDLLADEVDERILFQVLAHVGTYEEDKGR
jgi:hypothetical protein